MPSVWGVGRGTRLPRVPGEPKPLLPHFFLPDCGRKKKERRERKSEKSFCNILTAAFDSGRSLIAPNRSSDPALSEEQLPRTQERWRCSEAGWGTSPPGKDRILGVEAPKAPTDIQWAKEIPEGLVDPCSGPRGLPGRFLGEERLRQVL